VREDAVCVHGRNHWWVGGGRDPDPPPKNNWTTQPLRSFLVGVTDCANVGVLFYKNFWRRAVIPQTKNLDPQL